METATTEDFEEGDKAKDLMTDSMINFVRKPLF